MYYSKGVLSWCDGLLDWSIIDPVNYISFQPVFHDWYNEDRGVC